MNLQETTIGPLACEVFEKEIPTINREFMNLKAFSMTGQLGEMENSAQEIENACERIRAAARPHTLGFWRRLQELRGRR